MEEDRGTAADLAYSSLLGDLTRRTWPVDTRLKSGDLAQGYGLASGAVREALIRLAAQGFVRNFPQRGFRTIAGDRRSVSDQAALRVAIEVEAARLSVSLGDLEWEADLAAAHHRLSHLETRLRRRSEPTEDELETWTAADQAFHYALVSACGSEALITAQREAFTRFRLHLSSAHVDWGFRGASLIGEHEAILVAALDRDADACADAIRAHFAHYPKILAAGEVAAAG